MDVERMQQLTFPMRERVVFVLPDDPWTNNPRHVGKWHCRICNRVFAHPSHQYTACAVQAHLVSPAHRKAAHL